MLRPMMKYGNRTLLVVLETLAVVAFLAAALFGVFVWKISQGPLSLGFAKSYVEEGLSREDDNISVAFDDIVLSWPDLNGPLLLDLTGLHVQMGEGEANTLFMDKAAVGLSGRALLFGRIRPSSVIITSPSLELVRAKDGSFNIRVEDKEIKQQDVPEEQAVRQPPGERIAQIFKDMAQNRKGSLLARLDEFEVRNASVIVRDEQFGKTWHLTDMDFAMREHPEGIASSLRVALPEGETKNASLSLDMVYRKKTDDFMVAGDINNMNPAIVSRFLPVADAMAGQDLYFSGKAEAALNGKMEPQIVRFEGAIPEGQISIPAEYDAPIAIRNISVKTEYSAEGGVLSIPVLSGEIGGIGFSGQARATISEDAMSMPVEVSVEDAELAQIPPLFPKSEIDGEAYEWLGRKLQGGKFSDVKLNMEVAATRVHNTEKDVDEWKYTLPQMKVGFAFEGASVQYNSTLMPAENASGRGMLDLTEQVLDITEGKATIGDMQGSDVAVQVTHLMTKGAGYVSVKAKLAGPLSTALDYIALPPIAMDKEQIGLDPRTVKGAIAADIEVALPTIKDVPKDEVKVSINGTLTDLDIPSIVEGLPLSGGPLTLATEPGGFRIKGDAKLDGRDTVIDWHQFFSSEGHPYSMQVNAKIGADRELRNHFGVNLDDYIRGTMPVDVTYTRQGNGDSDVAVKGDLSPVRIYIKPFKYEKPAGRDGSLSVKAVLKKDVLKELNELNIKSGDLSVTNAKIGFAPRAGKKADLNTGSLPDAVIGKTRMAVTFKTDKNGVMNIDAKGKVFDLAPFLMETESSTLNVEAQQRAASPVKTKQQKMRISVTADTMLAKNKQTAKAAKGYLEIDEDGDITQLEYDATVGKSPLFVRFKPDAGGKRTFRLDSNDAGAVLYTFGLYENIHGGRLLIYGAPKGEDLRGNLYGAMRMENFRVVRAPALASLLSLMSLSGVSQLLTNQGLVFSKLEAGFEWRFRPEGNLLIVKDGKTSGSSIGLTFSGVVDRGKKTTDIAGTIIPMTEVNSLLSKIPVVGDILGGAGGLIAATYSMKGPTSDPKVSVNPLSVLAPGILRRILFEGGYESKIPEDAPAAKPEAAKAGAKAPLAKNASRPPEKAKAANAVKARSAPVN